jgi:fatty acid desaturase
MKTALAPETNSMSHIYDCNSPGEQYLLDRSDISAEKRKYIREFHKLNIRYNLRILVFIGIWILCGYAVLVIPFLAVKIGCWFLIACSMSGLTILMHDGNHGLLFKSHSLNRWVGFICGLPGLVAVSAYRSIHLQHHRKLHTDEDPDNIETASKKSMPLVLFYYVFFVVGTYLYLPFVALTGFKLANRRVKIEIAVEYLLMAVVLMSIFVVVPISTLMQVWLIPLVIAAQISNVRGLAEHGMTTGGSPFTDTRTVVSNRFVSFMMCNLNYHLEHHLFPGIPWYNLPKLHRLLQDEFKRAGSSVYRSYTEFLMDFVKRSFKGLVPNVRLIPVHLREDICG